MTAPLEFGRSLLGLLIRRWPLLVVCMVLGATAGFIAADRSETAGYEARTLVVANRWEQRIEGLARMVETVLQTNDYREQILQVDPEAFPGPATIDQTVDVVPVQDTVAVWVEATASTPEVAQRRANAAGDTLVLELNRLGSDIGVFAVQDRAPLPTAPIEADLSPVATAALAALAGLILGSGLVVAWPDKRRQKESEALEIPTDLELPGRQTQPIPTEADLFEPPTRLRAPRSRAASPVPAHGDPGRATDDDVLIELREAVLSMRDPAPPSEFDVEQEPYSVRRIESVPPSELPPLQHRRD